MPQISTMKVKGWLSSRTQSFLNEKPREKPREKDAKELNENNYNGHLASIIIYSYIYIL